MAAISRLFLLFSMHTSISVASAAGGLVQRFDAHVDDAPCWKHLFLLKPLFAEVKASIIAAIRGKIIF